jgi:hypothetical protein
MKAGFSKAGDQVRRERDRESSKHRLMELSGCNTRSGYSPSRGSILFSTRAFFNDFHNSFQTRATTLFEPPLLL